MSELLNSLVFIKGCDIIKDLEKIIIEYLKQQKLKLVSMKFITEFGNKILQILIDKEDETFVNTDELTQVNNYISSYLDEHDLFDFNYLLEVSSCGAEKEIHLENLKHHIGSYVTINDNIVGTILEVDDLNLILKQNLKGRIKKINIPLNEIKKTKLTIKF